jgi:hypothetical protein
MASASAEVRLRTCWLIWIGPSQMEVSPWMDHSHAIDCLRTGRKRAERQVIRNNRHAVTPALRRA